MTKFNSAVDAYFHIVRVVMGSGIDILAAAAAPHEARSKMQSMHRRSFLAVFPFAFIPRHRRNPLDGIPLRSTADLAGLRPEEVAFS